MAASLAAPDPYDWAVRDWMDKTLLFKTKDAERPYDYWILICVNCASEVSAPWWRGETSHRANIPGP